MNGLSLKVTAGLTCLLVAGCKTTAPPSAKGDLGLKLPPAWEEREATLPVADTSWVSAFKSAGLDETVDAALEGNRSLKAAAARIKAAEAQAVIAGSDLLPVLSGELDGRRSQRNFIGFPFGPGGQEVIQSNLNNDFGLSLDISWEIDIWGRIRDSKSAAIGELEAREADYNAAQLSLAAQVSKIWFSIIASREQRDLAQEAADIFRDSEETIERGIRLQGGDTAQLYLAQSDVASAEASVAQNEEQLLRLRKQLDALLGQYPAGNKAVGGSLPSTPAAPPAGIPAEVLDRRPDLRAAERRLAAADRRVSEARKSLLPRINLTGSTGTATEDIGEILNSDFFVWNLGGGLVQPILQGGQLRQTIRVREADWEVEVANYQDAALTAFREVEEALGADRYLATREAALRRAVSISREALDQSREDYVGGTGDVLTLLRSQQSLINARSALIEVRRQKLENRVDLHVALGGSFRAQTSKATVNE